MTSVVVGSLLAALYALSVHRWVFRSSQKVSKVSQVRFIASALFRLVLIVSVFFFLLSVKALDISVVLLSFIGVITLYLFFLARKVTLSTVKTGGIQSQGRF